MLFSQAFDPSDLGTIGLLVILEGALSVDNALVLGVLASRVPPEKAGKALAFGLAGAFVFRLLAVLLASYLLQWPLLKVLGAAYLIYLAARHFIVPQKPSHLIAAKTGGSFWRAVIGIELTDIAFAIDNVLAAVALVGPPPRDWPAGRVHPKLWVILTGGMLGILLTRFSATLCLKLLRRFPRMETGAYLLVMVVAVKLLLEWRFGSRWDFQDYRQLPFWAFWAAMIGCLGMGLTPGRRDETGEDR